MLEQYSGNFKVGEDVLERGLVLERIRIKAAILNGETPETDKDILKKAVENVYRPEA